MKKNNIKPIAITCKDCGTVFTITVEEQLFAQENKGYVLPKRCPSCRNRRKKANKKLTCVECGCTFDFNASEQQFYAMNGFKDPKRCKNCRDARKHG